MRKRGRLPEFDYSVAGYYFITICTKDKRKLLCDFDVGARSAHLSEVGKTVERAIKQIGERYQAVEVNKYVIMPNHIHMILVIQSSVEDNGRAMQTVRAPTISTVVNQFKGFVTKQVGFSIWQKSFYDHVIRNEDDYLGIWRYIDDNPAKWAEDKYYV